MILSPQMQQAIHFLQVPLLELQTIIRQEIVQNPLLEEIQIQEQPEEENTPPEAKEENGEVEFKEEFDRLVQVDDEWRDYFQQTQTHYRSGPSEDKLRKFLEDSIVRQESLSEHLLRQLRLRILSEREVKIGEIIIGDIDENGYLAESVEEIAREAEVPVAAAAGMLQLIQTFHPLGIGARDLRECLLIQLRNQVRRDPLAEEIVENHLDELGRKKYPLIARALKITPERIQKAAEYISTLEPRPGMMFSPNETQYITPDIYLQKVDDNYRIILNDQYVPHLRINNKYRQLMEEDLTKPATKDYIKEKVKAALWLIKNIQLRQETLYKITEEIVKRQRLFLDRGLAYIQPLKMAEIAEVVGIHESTVSRAVANKYIQTPQGVFQLKYFFTTALHTSAGPEISSERVKETISRLIGKEDHLHPLSDQEIVDILTRQGIRLARRTVAKYRHLLRIPSSHRRKQY